MTATEKEPPKLLTRTAFRLALLEADAEMKNSNGHSYVTILKTRCIYCNRSPRVKTRCGRWLDTMMDRLESTLRERGFLVDEKQ